MDDSQTNLQMIRSVLGHQYALLLAVSGEMALRYAEKKLVDLVLLDLAMPGMDGRETLHALRQLPSCAAVPIIFLTASRDQSVEVECLRLGACAHHERFDGKGYPQGIKGESIPDVARIICIADAYDAMTTDRCYRPRLPLAEARECLLQGAGEQFDPELVNLL